MVTLAREISGFGGLFYEPGGDRMVVAMTEANATAAHFSAAQQAALRILTQDGGRLSLAAIPHVEFADRVVKYSFLELAQKRARLRSRLFQVPGVVALEVDEENNRIRIGLTDPSEIAVVQDLAASLAIPIEMLAFWETPPIDHSHLPGPTPRRASDRRTLRDAVPDGNLQGGYQVMGNSDGRCTLGFTALRAPGPQKVFVSNSHCSFRIFRYDGGSWGQPFYADTVGREIVDPSYHTCWVFGLLVPNVPWNKCRHSDAALMKVDTVRANIDLAMIGRTIERSNCESCAMPIIIDDNNPTIEITGHRDHTYDNEILHKIGRTTGWTYGAVESTCVDVLVLRGRSAGSLIECNELVDYSSDEGDSGSPVFEYDERRGTAELRGIHWGRVPWPWADAVMSDLHQIKKDLGPIWAYDPGPPYLHGIVGPTIVPRNVWCSWFADVGGGMTPLSYVWSGILGRLEK